MGPVGPAGPTGPTGPQGPAGADGSIAGQAAGALTGTYPNPGLADGAVGPEQIGPPLAAQVAGTASVDSDTGSGVSLGVSGTGTFDSGGLADGTGLVLPRAGVDRVTANATFDPAPGGDPRNRQVAVLQSVDPDGQLFVVDEWVAATADEFGGASLSASGLAVASAGDRLDAFVSQFNGDPGSSLLTTVTMSAEYVGPS